ncbi:hypothetical protein Tco_0731181 [Tanacetum coccineum]
MALGYQNPFYLKQAQQKHQSLYNGKVLLEKHDPLAVYDSEETLQLAQESRLKMKQLNKEIKPANYTNINHLSGEFLDDTTPNVARNFLNEVKSTIVTLQRVVKQKMTLDIHYVIDNDLSKPVTSNSVPTTEESKVIDNDKVIAPGMFRINPFKNPRVEKFVSNKPPKPSVRTNPITTSQPHVIIKKYVNSDSNGFSST